MTVFAPSAPNYTGGEIAFPTEWTCDIKSLAVPFYEGTLSFIRTFEDRAQEIGWRPDREMVGQLHLMWSEIDRYVRSNRKNEQRCIAMMLSGMLYLDALCGRIVLDMARRHNGPPALIERLEQLTKLVAHQEDGRWVVDQPIDGRVALVVCNRWLGHQVVV